MTRKEKTITISVIASTVVLVIVLIAIRLSTPKMYTLDVRFTEWNYTVRIQELKVVHLEGWDLDEGAYNVSSKKKKHGKEKVGEDSNGDPIYKDKYDPWYEYDVNRWFETRRVVTNGFDKKPYWGEYELYESDDVMGIGDERVLASVETYTVVGVLEGSRDNSAVSIEVPKDVWERVTNEDDIIYKKRSFGKPYDIDIAQ